MNAKTIRSIAPAALAVTVALLLTVSATATRAGDDGFPGLHGGAGQAISSMNLNGTKTKVDFRYHGPAGKKMPHIEARVLNESAKTVEVGLSLWEQDVAFTTYDAKRKTLEVYMTPEHLKDPTEVRIAILKMTPFEAPAGVTTVRVIFLP